mgnify:CR=1 FL=1
MDQRPAGLDDPALAAHAWARFRSIMAWMIAVAAACSAGAIVGLDPSFLVDVRGETLDSHAALARLAADPWRRLPLEEARELERLYQRAAADLARLACDRSGHGLQRAAQIVDLIEQGQHQRHRILRDVDIAPQISCPFLILHGQDDRVVPLPSAHKLYEAVGSKQKHLKLFGTEETGAQHAQVDNRVIGVDYIADWIAATLK